MRTVTDSCEESVGKLELEPWGRKFFRTYYCLSFPPSLSPCSFPSFHPSFPHSSSLLSSSLTLPPFTSPPSPRKPLSFPLLNYSVALFSCPPSHYLFPSQQQELPRWCTGTQVLALFTCDKVWFRLPYLIGYSEDIVFWQKLLLTGDEKLENIHQHYRERLVYCITKSISTCSL